MFLVFIKEVGTIYDNKFLYEFLFSTDILETYEEGLNECNWKYAPAAGKPFAPKRTIEKVSYLITEDKINLIQNSGTLNMGHAKDGIVALGWFDEMFFNKRLKFFYGDTYENIEGSLFNCDLSLTDLKTSLA